MTMAPDAPAKVSAPPAEPRTSIPAVIRRRLLPFDERLDPWSWFATGLVGLIAAILRFVNIGTPKGKIFDETYYATDAHWLWEKGFEWDEANNTAGYVVHPPLGKWLIGIGEQSWAFGYHETGWRIMAAVFGIGSIVMITRIARRMFGSTILGCIAGLLMALDGMHFVLSRSALLDIFLMFFIVAAFGCLVLDRDQRRRRWVRFIESGGDPSSKGRGSRPGFAVPWWRLASAAMLGCALGVKWSALAFLPLMVIFVYWWEWGARRSAGVRRPALDTLLDETGWLLACFAIVAVVYTATWSGWFFTDGGYNRHWLRDTTGQETAIWGTFQNWLHYHDMAFKFHTTLTSTHTYQSWPWQWPILGRPVAFYYNGDGPCGSAQCASEVILLGTPILWWSFLPAMAGTAWFGIARRDWRALTILAMIATAWLPWFYYMLDNRTMFYFYALPMEPFAILAVVYVLGAIMTPPPGSPPDENRRMMGAIVAGTFVLLVALNFAYFYPIYTGQPIPYADWARRMWLGSRWI